MIKILKYSFNLQRALHSFFFFLASVDYISWCLGDAVHVGRLLQAGWLCGHWLQPGIWLCHLQPLLHHSSWKTVSKCSHPVTPYRTWICSNFCCLSSSLGVIWAWEGTRSLFRLTPGIIPPMEMGRSLLARPILHPLKDCHFPLNNKQIAELPASVSLHSLYNCFEIIFPIVAFKFKFPNWKM